MREKCSCKTDDVEAHTCPFACDVGNDKEFLCKCCEECERNCSEDI